MATNDTSISVVFSQTMVKALESRLKSSLVPVPTVPLSGNNLW